MIIRNKKRVYAIPSLLVLGALACGFSLGSEEPTPGPDLAGTQAALEATRQALANLQAQPTADPEPADDSGNDSTQGDDPAFYVEEFSSVPQSWTYFLLRGDDLDFDLYMERDRLVYDIDGPNVWAYYTYDSWSYTDVRVDARAENLGSNNNNVSLICRYNDRGWYEFNVANNGLYWIYRYDDRTGDFQELYSGGVQNLRVGKDTNEYTIICQGDRLTLGINGVEIRTVTDSNYDEGLIGVSVSSFDNYPVLVEFDWVEISQP
ncbi:MAG: hypothetical protein ACRDFQ_09405 [Anaerolineales bacterium]